MNAVTRMREAGIHVPLIIDAASWGQNINLLQIAGPSLIEVDPDKNLMFSVHLWWRTQKARALRRSRARDLEPFAWADKPVRGALAPAGPGATRLLWRAASGRKAALGCSDHLE